MKILSSKQLGSGKKKPTLKQDVSRLFANMQSAQSTNILSGFPSKTLLVTVFLLFCSVVSGCPSSRQANLKDDLTQYLEKARLWAASEAKINNAIAAVRQDQFVHDDFVANTLKPAIGVAQEYIQELEGYNPSTPPVHNVHLEYIEAWRAHFFAMAAVVDAVEKKDYIQLAKANNDLLEAQRSVSDALADLARLLKEAGLGGESPDAPSLPPPPGEGFTVSPS